MSSTKIWLAIVGMMIVTAVTRSAFLLGGDRLVLPERVLRALRYAPAAALIAVVIPDVAITPQGLSFGLENHAWYGAVAGTLWFLWRRSMVQTIIVGMLAFTALRLWCP
ncbi:AzlD domain-containing protein [Candidatus Vallotia tarda]|uniref:Branched-chain amino acid transport protein azlD n=1 Tax=Candidatus Vallotiella hemipterorum TaxID=1177213 RepID=A0A916NF83_9BURK|nr:AzlD domain-containing protein [Candidatus Vallotia tarda]CAG7597371.1 Branched-chain amino acid transport protein azlD [Candidatus Vallotia tarda]